MYSHGFKIQDHMTQTCPLYFWDCLFCHCCIIYLSKIATKQKNNLAFEIVYLQDLVQGLN